MKRLGVFLCVLLLAGCLGKPFVIPDEPIPTRFKIYQIEGGICIDNQGLGVLRSNLNDLKAYADEMRKILEGLK